MITQEFSFNSTGTDFQSKKAEVETQLASADSYSYQYTTNYSYRSGVENKLELFSGSYSPASSSVPDHLKFNYAEATGSVSAVYNDAFQLQFVKPGVMTAPDLVNDVYFQELAITDVQFLSGKKFKLYSSLREYPETVTVSTDRKLFIDPASYISSMTVPTNGRIGVLYAKEQGFQNPIADSLIVFSEVDKVYGSTAKLFVYIGCTRRTSSTPFKTTVLNVGIFKKISFAEFEQNRVIY